MDQGEQSPRSAFEGMLRAYRKVMENDVSAASSSDAKFILPIFPTKTLSKLVLAVTEIFKAEPIMLQIYSPTTVVGDIHGHIVDLFRILLTQGFPPSTSYLFLGDLVDRGEFSLETVTLVYLLKLLYPENVHLIRGNHEFLTTSTCGGFESEMQDIRFRGPLFGQFINSFSYIPLCATLFSTTFCIHAGPAPKLTNLLQLQKIQRPIETFDDEIVCSVLWSDPTETTQTYGPSSRGSGYIFGETALSTFLQANELTMMVRGHECVMEGSKLHFNGKLLTVFSASNYCGVSNNFCSIAIFKARDSFETLAFPPLGYIKRDEAVFCDIRTLNAIPTMASCPDESLKSEAAKVIHPEKPVNAKLNVQAKLMKLMKYRQIRTSFSQAPASAVIGKSSPRMLPKIVGQ